MHHVDAGAMVKSNPADVLRNIGKRNSRCSQSS